MQRKQNKKIRNAVEFEENGLKFKSKLEASIYKYLLQAGFNPSYECIKYTIWEGVSPTVPFYIIDKKNKCLKKDMKKLINITYTPDITFVYNKYTVIIEVKPNFCNDVYPYKRKMFRKYLENLKENIIFAQINSVKTLSEFLNILKAEYGQTN